MFYRVIDKATWIFIRDDFTFDEATEIGLDVSPAQGFIKPKWDGEKWAEGATFEEMVANLPQPAEPTLEERVTKVEQDRDEIITVLAEITGVSV